MLYETIQSHVQEALDYLYTSLPAVITKVGKKGNSTVVNAQPLINRVSQEGYADFEPIIEDVPVQWPQGGGFRITCPLEVGDNVMLHFTMRGAMEVKNSDGKKPVTSLNKRLHSLPDAFAVPTTLTYSSGKEIDSDALSVGSDSMEIRITKEGSIELGKDAAEHVMLGDAFITKFLAHTHTYVDSIGPNATITPKLTSVVGEVLSAPDLPVAWADVLSKKVTTL